MIFWLTQPLQVGLQVALLRDCALIAAGRINGRVWNKTLSYDIAAGIPIVLGAGGCVSDFLGNQISVLASKVIMSSERDLHDRLIKEISSI